jgi:uncharacterized protein YecE (DUF72 family)
MIRLGTSGFSYDDWVGVFYPPDLPKREWLTFYAREFDTVELNVTYYRARRHTVLGWIDRTPSDFVFAVKAFGGLTHERREPDFAGFVEAIEPLRQAGKLGCVLAQFPFSFGPTAENWAYLERLKVAWRSLGYRRVQATGVGPAGDVRSPEGSRPRLLLRR